MFLGIPVDGSERNMKYKLSQKGFKDHGSYLTGQFNGETVDVYIHTNHQIVDRIYVAFQPTDEHEIRFKYNRLLAQFRNNKKYIDLIGNEEIAPDENISHEIDYNHKTYEAAFSYFNPDMDYDTDQILNVFFDKISSQVSEEEIATMRSLGEQFSIMSDEEKSAYYSELSKSYADIGWTAEQAQDFLAKMQAVLQALQSTALSMSTGQVWFRISETYGRYFIGLYYDNLSNRPNGEDL